MTGKQNNDQYKSPVLRTAKESKNFNLQRQTKK